VSTISKTTRFKVFRRDGFTCRYCGRRPPEVVLHCDHVHPRCAGGSDEMDNLVTACVDCNLSKSGRPLSVEVAVAVRPSRAPWPVGWYVLTGEPRGWQGEVQATTSSGALVVMRFSWVTGLETSQAVVPMDEVEAEGWEFYADHQTFLAAARHESGFCEPDFHEKEAR
jgi:hypothetical protein